MRNKTERLKQLVIWLDANGSVKAYRTALDKLEQIMGSSALCQWMDERGI